MNEEFDFSHDLETAIDQIGGHRKETEEMRRKRLIQNKKSAQKCRLKKALEFEKMRLQAEMLQE